MDTQQQQQEKKAAKGTHTREVDSRGGKKMMTLGEPAFVPTLQGG